MICSTRISQQIDHRWDFGRTTHLGPVLGITRTMHALFNLIEPLSTVGRLHTYIINRYNTWIEDKVDDMLYIRYTRIHMRVWKIVIDFGRL